MNFSNLSFDGVIAWLVAQVFGTVVWGARLEFRMRSLERAQEKLETVPTDVALIKRDIEYIREAIDELKLKWESVTNEDRSFNPHHVKGTTNGR